MIQCLSNRGIRWLQGKHQRPGINTICMAIRERDVNRKASTESAYFISSLENHAPTIAKPVREHWGIKNGLHWCLDISFREDDCRVCNGHAPEDIVRLGRHLFQLREKLEDRVPVPNISSVEEIILR